MELILVSLKRSGCLVFITLKKMKFQRLNQKLWPPFPVYFLALYGIPQLPYRKGVHGEKLGPYESLEG